MSQNAMINGNRFSFVDIDITMNGVQQIKGVFSSINYTSSQEPGLVQGNQVAPVGRTAGYGTATGSFQMLLSDFDDLVQNILGLSPIPSIMNVDFAIVVSFSVNQIDVRTDVLQGARITKVEISNQKGSDASMVSCDLSIMNVLVNGVAAFSQGDH